MNREQVIEYTAKAVVQARDSRQAHARYTAIDANRLGHAYADWQWHQAIATGLLWGFLPETVTNGIPAYNRIAEQVGQLVSDSSDLFASHVRQGVENIVWQFERDSKAA